MLKLKTCPPLSPKVIAELAWVAEMEAIFNQITEFDLLHPHPHCVEPAEMPSLVSDEKVDGRSRSVSDASDAGNSTQSSPSSPMQNGFADWEDALPIPGGWPMNANVSPSTELRQHQI